MIVLRLCAFFAMLAPTLICLRLLNGFDAGYGIIAAVLLMPLPWFWPSHAPRRMEARRR